jgi:hypothetical protein
LEIIICDIKDGKLAAAPHSFSQRKTILNKDVFKKETEREREKEITTTSTTTKEYRRETNLRLGGGRWWK